MFDVFPINNCSEISRKIKCDIEKLHVTLFLVAHFRREESWRLCLLIYGKIKAPSGLCGSQTGSRWPSCALRVGSYTLHKPINTLDTVATQPRRVFNSCLHVFNPVIASCLSSFFIFLSSNFFFSLATQTKTHWGCVKPLAVNCQEQCESPVGTMWFLNCLLLAVFSESLPAAPRPLMAPRARSAVSTVAKSQLGFFPARSREAFWSRRFWGYVSPLR